jgi:Tol biopolymer transport system component
MTLAAGRSLAHYTILAPLGAGAMGEVWRAKDTRLGREVAIKVLPEHFAADPDRLKRFEREAKTLATLNHPNVAQIFGVDQVGDTCFLVLELVEGQSLQERLRRGALPLDEALDVCRQIAEGLEAAHEAGVIHRDLKPANVRLTPDGRVKVLDFGLAKPARDSADPATSTDSVLSTEAGRLLGTPTYMAPEQARSKPIDRRVDIWAFGCVLYECLTAQRAFAGETLTDVFAAVIERQPDWTKLPPATPPRVRELLQRCFEKDPRSRLRDIGEARLLLADPATRAERPGSVRDVAPVARRRVRASALLVVAAGGVGAALVLAFGRDSAALPTPVRRYELTDVYSNGRSQLAISPDGQWVAWCEAGRDLPIKLRRLDGFEDRTIPDSVNGSSPFFAPDSRSLAFFVHGRGLLRVALEPGAAVQTITADAMQGIGDWGSDGTIVFTGGLHDGASWPGLMRVPASGGRPEVLTTVDTAQAEHWHRWPHFMPDGRKVLFSVAVGEGHRIEGVDLATGERHPIADAGVNPRFLPSGHLAYGDVERNELLVAPMDAGSLRVTGPAVVAVPGVATAFSGLCFAVSDDGTLVYDPEVGQNLLVWFDREGQRTTLDTELGLWVQPRISPDGKRLLVRRIAQPNCSLWIVDLERGVKTRLPMEADPHDAIWSGDGTAILYDVMSGDGRTGVFRSMLDGGKLELLAPSAEHELSCNSLSPDGRFLAMTSSDKATTAPDIELLELATGVRTSLLATKAAERFARFSPDGRSIAYVSDDTGRQEVYLRPFPGPGAAVRVSTEGGTSPVWSRDGRELFFTVERSLFAVGVETAPALQVGTPALLFESEARSPLFLNVDVSADGQRFYAAVSSQGANEVRIVRVVTNWFEEVRRLAPTEPGR